MSRIRIWSGLAAVTLLLATAASAAAQYNDNVRTFGGNWDKASNKWQPFGPTGFEMDVEPFGIFTEDDYDGADAFSQGPYLTYNRLNWNISRPDKRPMGDPRGQLVSADGRTFNLQSNGRDLAVRFAPFTWGDRFDLGYWDGRTGWGGSVLSLNTQLQEYLDTQVAVNFDDPDGINRGFVDIEGGGNGIDDDLDGDGNLGRFVDDGNGGGTLVTDAADVDLDDLVRFPTVFDELRVRNKTDVSGVELMKMYRFRPFHGSGSIFELFLGARYLELNDQFHVEALGGFTNQFANLGVTINPDNQQQVPLRVQSFWFQEVDNNIVGPQLGGRWYNRRGAWNFVAEGRFLAGFNFQNVKQRGQLGGNIPNSVVVQNGNQNNVLVNAPVAFDNSNFYHFERFEEFSPIGELRFQTTYSVTKAVELQVGWTGMYSAGIARAANTIVYRLPNLGIAEDNREGAFVHGVDFGLTFNR